MAVFVSRYDHCLQDLLWRHRARELPCHLKLGVSNHAELEPPARLYDIPNHVLPKSPETREDQEERELKLLEEHEVDAVVLARYMQLLSPKFVGRFPPPPAIPLLARSTLWGRVA